MERRLAAILAADVVGYSRLMGADEAGTLARLKACESDVIDPTVARHGGRVVKRMGDGFLVEFASVVAAVECALAWQAAAGEPIMFRIGVHLGDIMFEGDDVYGEGVNVAARLEGLAQTGGIALSEDAQRQVRGKIDASFEDLGPRELKNIAEPIRVFHLGSAAEVSTEASSTPSIWRMPRVLMVPFRPLGANPDAAALAEGITETLAAALAHFEEFDLVDPGSAATLVAEQGARDAGRQLKAAYVLEGTIQLALNKVRIGVQLVEVASGERVWSESLDRDLDDIFALQDDVTAFVASTLGEAVGEEQARIIAHKPIEDMNAFELAIRGIQHLHRTNAKDNVVARDLFERALALAPGRYFLAICLGWTHVLDLGSGWPLARPDALDFSHALISDVLRRHDRSAHAHRIMGRICAIQGDQDQALAHSERCYRLNPYHSDMILAYGMALIRVGRSAEGVALVERAFHINPYAPAYYRVYLSLAYFIAERFEEGLTVLKDVDDGIGAAPIAKIANLVALGRDAEARAEVERLQRNTPGFSFEVLLGGLPFRQADDQNRLVEVLTRAGLGVPLESSGLP